uniref:Uncharacterized protein n=1 Tax=Anguilla anguilla TaxID=7936 RepID=A0A0E9VGS4_ANGAN
MPCLEFNLGVRQVSLCCLSLSLSHTHILIPSFLALVQKLLDPVFVFYFLDHFIFILVADSLKY